MFLSTFECHNIDPIIFQMGPLGVRWYGLMYLLGFAFGFYLLKTLKKQELLNVTDDDAIYDTIFYAVLGSERMAPSQVPTRSCCPNSEAVVISVHADAPRRVFSIESLLRNGREPLELADVFAWLASIASQCGVSLEEAVDKYRNGCPVCHAIPCKCPE